MASKDTGTNDTNRIKSPDEPWDDTFDLSADEPVCLSVVRAVATVTGRDQASLPPLYEVVEPDALDAFIEAGNATPSRPATVTFMYASCQVTVDAAGHLCINYAGADKQSTESPS